MVTTDLLRHLLTFSSPTWRNQHTHSCVPCTFNLHGFQSHEGFSVSLYVTPVPSQPSITATDNCISFPLIIRTEHANSCANYALTKTSCQPPTQCKQQVPSRPAAMKLMGRSTKTIINCVVTIRHTTSTLFQGRRSCRMRFRVLAIAAATPASRAARQRETLHAFKNLTALHDFPRVLVAQIPC